MLTFILHKCLKFIKFIGLIALALTASACAQGKITLELPSGKIVKLEIADTLEKQTRGLSGIKKEQFPTDKGMLFIYKNDGHKRFWMPNTHFNLDIFFLDSNFKVLEIDRNVPFFPKRTPTKKIPTTRTIFCRHVLELRADSPLAKEIKKGMTLKISL